MALEGTQGDAPQSEPAPADELRLPASVVGIADVNRLSRELEAFEDFVRQARARTPGSTAKLTPPRTSRLLDDLASLNQLSLLEPAARQQLEHFLEQLQTAPSIHISFSSDPSAAFTQKIVTWLRRNIHPDLLLQVGLQPTIAAGCIVRTQNRVFDFSLHENFTQNRQILINAITGRESAS